MATVFYSWQSVLENSTNRGFIEDALEKAVKSIRADGSLAVDPRVDMDVQGIPGAPDIAATILAKIDSCAVFVADVSIVHGADVARRCPNPNVLLELGYAMRAVGASRVVLVMNTRFGGPEELPFDLKQRSVMRYDLGVGEEKGPARKALVERLVGAVGASLQAYQGSLAAVVQPDPLADVIALVENAKPTRAARVLDHMKGIAASIAELQRAAPGDDAVAFLAGFDKTLWA